MQDRSNWKSVGEAFILQRTRNMLMMMIAMKWRCKLKMKKAFVRTAINEFVGSTFHRAAIFLKKPREN